MSHFKIIFSLHSTIHSWRCQGAVKLLPRNVSPTLVESLSPRSFQWLLLSIWSPTCGHFIATFQKSCSTAWVCQQRFYPEWLSLVELQQFAQLSWTYDTPGKQTGAKELLSFESGEAKDRDSKNDSQRSLVSLHFPVPCSTSKAYLNSRY